MEEKDKKQKIEEIYSLYYRNHFPRPESSPGNIPMVLDMLENLLLGIKFLWENNISHRDLKFGNIMLDGIKPKIIDFGSAYSENCPSITQ